ncbi:ribosome-binding protein 1-like [Lineus longissimus]|uniref:ribosome-binding protein 1-like n=1 Tax=Lineus longissimus TaxID=88925 RepID=UPI00315D517B
MKKESRPPAREPRRHWMDLKNMLLPMLEPYREARANIVQGPQGPPGPQGQGTQGQGTQGQGTQGQGTQGQGTQGQGTQKTMLQSVGPLQIEMMAVEKTQPLNQDLQFVLW